MTSIAAMVMTPPLLSPANNSDGVAIPMNPATSRAQISASTAGARPLTMTVRVMATMMAATTGMAAIIDSQPVVTGIHLESVCPDPRLCGLAAAVPCPA